jgi:peptidoglycan-N-acetylglucosamine deacetylase
MILLLLAAAFGATFLAHTAPFPFLLEVLQRERTLWQVPHDGGQPAVYLTYDDGPNPTATPALLDVLAAEEARATFFLIDRHLTEETAPIVRRMFEEGHGVALHSHTRELMILPPHKLAAELERAAARVERLAGHRPLRLFRPHAGWRSGAMYEGLNQAGYLLVGWGWQLWDFNWYRRPNPVRVVPRFVRRARAGDIIVMHDGHHVNPRADRRHTVEITARLLPRLRARGFIFRVLTDQL